MRGQFSHTHAVLPHFGSKNLLGIIPAYLPLPRGKSRIAKAKTRRLADSRWKFRWKGGKYLQISSSNRGITPGAHYLDRQSPGRTVRRGSAVRPENHAIGMRVGGSHAVRIKVTPFPPSDFDGMTRMVRRPRQGCAQRRRHCDELAPS